MFIFYLYKNIIIVGKLVVNFVLFWYNDKNCEKAQEFAVNVVKRARGGVSLATSQKDIHFGVEG